MSLWRAPAGGEDRRAQAAATLDWLRSDDGHPADRWWTAQSAALVERALVDLAPDTVILEHLWTWRAIAPARRAGCTVVLNSHNVEGQLHEEFAALAEAGAAPRALAARLARRTAQIERAAVEAVDQVWAVSELDRTELLRRYPRSAPVELVPNGVDTATITARPFPPDMPTVLFPASFGYPPNVSAAVTLISEVLPRARRHLPRAHLVLAGSGPPRALRDLAERAGGVTVTGAEPDVQSRFAQASVVAVPVTAGGGSRYKILEAFAAGVPVVSTAKGIEGIDARDDREFISAETPDAFAKAVVRICQEPALGQRLATRARALVEARYSWTAAADHIAEAMAGLAPREWPRSTERPRVL